MSWGRWAIVSTGALVLALLAGATWFVDNYRSLSFDIGCVPKYAPLLTQSDIEQLLSDRYKVARHVRQIPPTLRESFTNITGLPFDMNNPGDPMSTDAIIHAPSRQLIFAAVGNRSAMVVYEQGGFTSIPCVVLLSKSGGAAWITINGYPPTDVPAVQRNVHEARFERLLPHM